MQKYEFSAVVHLCKYTANLSEIGWIYCWSCSADCPQVMEAVGHVVEAGLQSGQHALLLSSSRESTWEPIIDHSK